MTEPTPAPSATDTDQGQPSDADAQPKPTETVEFWKQKAREQEKRAKDNATAAQRLAELEASNLSELEKAQKAASDAAARLAEYERTTLRQQIALEMGVPAKWVNRLVGETEDDLRADAESILADLAPGGTKSPKPDPSQGPRATASGSTADQFAAALQNFL